MVSRLHRIWNRAKVGTKIWLGPITLHIRLGRTVAVSRNPGRASVPIQSAKSIPLRGSNAISPADQQTSDEQSSEPWQRSTHRPEIALIVGTGPGLGSSLARRFAKAGMTVAVAARNTKKLDGLLSELQMLGSVAHAFGCDATNEQSVKRLFALLTSELAPPDLVVYNVEHFIPGTILDIEVAAFEECWRAMTLGGFLVGREAARSMAPRGKGTIIYTGATGALRGRAEYINMAVGKFGVRALAQSMARDLGPKGIHVAHVIIDGGIMSKRSPASAHEQMSSLFPDSIAESFYQLHTQHRSTWTQEMDLRPWVEKF